MSQSEYKPLFPLIAKFSFFLFTVIGGVFLVNFPDPRIHLLKLAGVMWIFLGCYSFFFIYAGLKVVGDDIYVMRGINWIKLDLNDIKTISATYHFIKIFTYSGKISSRYTFAMLWEDKYLFNRLNSILENHRKTMSGKAVDHSNAIELYESTDLAYLQKYAAFPMIALTLLFWYSLNGGSYNSSQDMTSIILKMFTLSLSVITAVYFYLSVVVKIKGNEVYVRYLFFLKKINLETTQVTSIGNYHAVVHFHEGVLFSLRLIPFHGPSDEQLVDKLLELKKSGGRPITRDT